MNSEILITSVLNNKILAFTDLVLLKQQHIDFLSTSFMT